MAKYLKLFEFELKRARPFLLLLVGITVIGQLLIFAWKYSQSTGVVRYSFEFVDFFDNDKYYNLLIVAIMMAVFFYGIYIWFREWMNDGKFIYRLATIPGTRLSIALAKLTTIFVMIFTLLLVQNLLFRIINELIVITGLNETKYWVDLYTGQTYNLSALLMPTSLLAFLGRYLYGFTFLVVVSNALLILLMNYRVSIVSMIGKIFIYLSLSIIVIIAILWLIFAKLEFSQQEQWLEFIIILIYCLGQIGFSKFLLDHQFNV